MGKSKVPMPQPPKSSSRITKKNPAAVLTQPNLTVNFSKFNLSPIRFSNEFNNHFKNQEHFNSVVVEFLGKILPTICARTYSQICEGSRDGKALHFHTIDKKHLGIVRRILQQYGYSSLTIEQMTEGNDIFEFSAALGHAHAARIVCHKNDNILYLLFFDTNHHIYFNERLVRESLSFEFCPSSIAETCTYMPDSCFAVNYLDEKKLSDSYGYSFDPHTQ